MHYAVLSSLLATGLQRPSRLVSVNLCWRVYMHSFLTYSNVYIEPAGQNMAKRVLHMIEEENSDLNNGESDDESALEESGTSQLVARVRQGIVELIDEIENSCTNIANQALEHIHSK